MTHPPWIFTISPSQEIHSYLPDFIGFSRRNRMSRFADLMAESRFVAISRKIEGAAAKRTLCRKPVAGRGDTNRRAPIADPAAEIVEVHVKHGRDVEREELRQEKSADYG